MLIVGQTLWKYGVMHMQIEQHATLVKKALAIGFNPYILLGCVVYVIATVFYIYTIGKYAYGTSYAMIVALSLIFATTVAATFFQEKITPINVAGVIVMLIGVFLVLKR